MTPQTRRILFSLAVLFWSGVILYFYGSGRMNKYLAADFRLIAFAGGIGLAVLSLFNLITAGRSSGYEHDHCGEDHHDHEKSGLHPVSTCLFMIVPVALSAGWTRDDYSASALARKGLYDRQPAFAGSRATLESLEQIEKNHPKSPEGFHRFSLMDLSYSTGEGGEESMLDGLKVETEGRWMDEKVRNPHGTRKRLYRLLVTCCAADSRAVPLVLEFERQPPEFPENAWVKVSGTMRFLLEDGVPQPVLIVEQSSAATPPPEETFTRKKS